MLDIDDFDKLSEVSFNSNEKEFIEVISWDTESNESDLNLDDENYRMFNKYREKYMLDDDQSQNSQRGEPDDGEAMFSKHYDYDFHNFKRNYKLKNSIYTGIQEMNLKERGSKITGLDLATDHTMDAKKSAQQNQNEEFNDDNGSYDYEMIEERSFKAHE